jgi:hypothetical protein
MAMDVFGLNPTGEKGKFFGNTVSWWHPLASYCLEVAPEISNRCKAWHTNDGDGLNKKDALALADALAAEMKSGRTDNYAEVYDAARRIAPDEKCSLCEGTGVRKPIPQRGAGELIEGGLKCNGCDGTGNT